MIAGFRDEWRRAFFVEDRHHGASRRTSKACSSASSRWVDDGTSDQDLRAPPSNHFEKLRGRLADFHSIGVNGQWRPVFRWNSSSGEADGIYLDDHSYR